jgi:outer membrane protein assembly factor BamB
VSLVSLSCTDGHVVWKNLDTNEDVGYSSSLLCPMAGRIQLVVGSDQGVYSYNPEDGSVLWFVGNVDKEFVTTPVYHEKLQKVYITGSWTKRKFWPLM